MEKLPDSGVYLLLINNPKRGEIEIGALGNVLFSPGYYVYVGSAQRNLRRRVERHRRREKRLKWHIDYFLQYARVEEVIAYSLPKSYEEKISRILCERYPFVPKFGASDTKARSHLFYIGVRDEWKRIKEILKGVK
ncbi:hypothetical protein AciM339_0563 [Aciduliprofundum sp. MAR08-339]|uniref:GIY-YIG nuclease family protein n=2 Tax=cellular organisms TaxID=131567 RepID=UPI0002A47BFB|nr:hypothetical protein AciM339_0563 [Aciduliprofundum sp. MAR08-339]